MTVRPKRSFQRLAARLPVTPARVLPLAQQWEA